MIRKVNIRLLLLGALLLLSGPLSAQEHEVKARIAGLETNEEYMTLLREDYRMQQLEESLTIAVEAKRRQLREDPDNRQLYSQDILQLENRIFEVRSAKGKLVDRINTIEQEWVLANLNGSLPTAPAESRPEPETPQEGFVGMNRANASRNLVCNEFFSRGLSPTDYAVLLEAQRLEMEAVDYVNRFGAHYATLSDLAEAYAATPSEEEANALYASFLATRKEADALCDSLARTWTFIYDNKEYAYSFLLDRIDREDLLEEQAERVDEAARRLADVGEAVASRQLADYFLRKRALVAYEETIAREMELRAACDSLHDVATQLDQVEWSLPKIEIEQRQFLVYDSVAFSTQPKYDAHHPIPECRVYSRGTIYRVLLGTFNTKRSVSIFRGAYPLFYLIDDQNRWCYYAGGFATEAEAEEARVRLKKRGFIRPEVVVWRDGVYRNLAQDPEPEVQAVACRIAISGPEQLPDAVKQQIAELAPGLELARVGQALFVVGQFDSREAAEALAEALRRTDPALEIKIEDVTGK